MGLVRVVHTAQGRVPVQRSVQTRDHPPVSLFLSFSVWAIRMTDVVFLNRGLLLDDQFVMSGSGEAVYVGKKGTKRQDD